MVLTSQKYIINTISKTPLRKNKVNHTKYLIEHKNVLSLVDMIIYLSTEINAHRRELKISNYLYPKAVSLFVVSSCITQLILLILSHYDNNNQNRF